MNTLSSIPSELDILEKIPSKLYYKGDISLLSLPKIAIIGSRRMSSYTKNCVLNLASACKNAGVVVVSGGAIGVDIYAAKASLPLSIAVFANGLDRIYPSINKNTIQELYTSGLALSENEPLYLPKPYDFLLRNRIIIALSTAIVVAQADFKSGSIASAILANKLKKSVYVLPQRLGESNATNDLLAKGKAKLLFDFDEFASSFGTPVKKSQDELILAVKNGTKLDELLKSFGQKVYEYELEGKIAINGVNIHIL